MSYNIDSIDIVSGELQITPLKLLRVVEQIRQELGGELPPTLEDALHQPEFYFDGCRVKAIPWHGEWSGHTEPQLRMFLAACDGTAALLLCWEGGDSYTGLIVDNGEVVEGEVVQTVRKKS